MLELNTKVNIDYVHVVDELAIILRKNVTVVLILFLIKT